ncbi:hypothetical protein JX265_000139 [Neoarthrinium moseri]|uniref:Uncharacterized protein n=1 Tax=Neoarthrinium moseri TaxID=1658444 RepID=A0A9Q0AUM2_9PEZI|nr:hypothetical protein JX265_000139 [Neoarthrinium moseri]
MLRTAPQRLQKGLCSPAATTAGQLRRAYVGSKSDPPAGSQQEGDASVKKDYTTPDETKSSEPKKKKKTMAELDEEMKRKMSGLSGDGGEAGIEYEDGQPVAMKRSVKNNMFRYI